MDNTKAPPVLVEPTRDFLAAERTFLAWIRTGLALMGFGFVVARFGLFVQELALAHPDLTLRSSGRSFPVGTLLIALGVAVNVASAWNHVRLMREFKRSGSVIDRTSTLGIIVALVLALLGAAMIVSLLSFDGPKPTLRETKESANMNIQAAE